MKALRQWTNQFGSGFTAQVIWVVGLNALIKPAYLFAIELNVQRTVGAEAYGLYYTMFNFSVLFSVLLDFGLPTLQRIEVAAGRTHGWLSERGIATARWLFIALYGAAGLVLGIVLKFDADHWHLALWLMLSLVLSSVLMLVRAKLGGLHLFGRDSFLSVFDRSFVVVACGALLWWAGSAFQVQWMVYTQCAAYATAIALGIWLTPASHRGWRPSFQFQTLKPTLLAAAPFALIILGMSIAQKTDALLIEHLHAGALVEAGHYAQAYRLLDAGNNFAFLYAALLVPMFSRLVVARASAEITALIGKAFHLLVMPATALAVLVAVKAPALVELLYADGLVTTTATLPWLMAAFVAMCATHVLGSLATVGAQRWLFALACLAVGGFSVLLNVWLIPFGGAVGAALSAFSSQFILAFLCLWLMRRLALRVVLFWVPVLLLFSGLLWFLLSSVGSSLVLALLVWAAVSLASWWGAWQLLNRFPALSGRAESALSSPTEKA